MQNKERKANFIDRKYGDCAFLYIIEAMLEYFVALSVADVYLVKIAAATGMSDQAIAVLTSFVSLGCGFQFLSIFFFRSSKVKKKATSGHVISQVLFTCAYLIPLATCSGQIKSVLLVIALLVAQILHNAVNAPKTDWYMSMLKNEKRGAFTAIKEIVSLFGGMAFTYGLAFLFDTFEDNGNQNRRVYMRRDNFGNSNASAHDYASFHQRKARFFGKRRHDQSVRRAKNIH